MTIAALLIGASSPLGVSVLGDLNSLGLEVLSSSRNHSDLSVRCDLQDPKSLESVLRTFEPRVVIDLARLEHGSVDQVNKSLQRYSDAIQIMVDNGVERVVFASSAGVYGTNNPEPRRESDEANAQSLYAQLKRGQEAILADAASTSMSSIALRIFNAYGPGLNGSLVNRLTDSKLTRPSVFRSRHFVRDYVHSTDIARAVRLACFVDVEGSTRLNVGTGHGTSNEELLQLADPGRWTDGGEAPEPSWSVAETSMCQEILGFTCSVSLEMAFYDPTRFIGG